MRVADHSARGRTGRVLPGPRPRMIAAVAAGLGLLMLQPGALAAGTFTYTPNLLTVGDQMTLTAPTLDPNADPMAPDPSTYRYEWDLNADGTPDKFGTAVTDTVRPDAGGTTPYKQTVQLKVIDPGVDPTPVDDDVVYDSGATPLSVGYAPDASFTVSAPSTTPRSGDTVTFTSKASDKDGDVDEATLRWYIDDNEVTEARGQKTLTQRFTEPREYKVELKVKDKQGRDAPTNQQRVNVAASPPVAAFVFSPSVPTTADTVEFSGLGSKDPDGTELRFAWDLNNDDRFDDGDAPTLTRRFEQPGDYVVKLRVKDASGADDVVTKTVTVKAAPAPPAPNAAPKASMMVAPRDPEVNQAVTLTSTASDSDGRIARVQWDVDNDGRFTDGGMVTTTSFTTPGNHVVALKVFDNDGASATAFETVTVKEPPRTEPQLVANRTLNPFPVVRIRGVILRRGVRVQILSVRAARLVHISVRCRGRGCPKRAYTTTLTRGTGVRIRAFERTLRPGVVLEVRVTKPGWVGKYTKFVIRKRSAPRRTDLCVGPVSTRPVKCEI